MRVVVLSSFHPQGESKTPNLFSSTFLLFLAPPVITAQWEGKAEEGLGLIFIFHDTKEEGWGENKTKITVFLLSASIIIIPLFFRSIL